MNNNIILEGKKVYLNNEEIKNNNIYKLLRDYRDYSTIEKDFKYIIWGLKNIISKQGNEELWSNDIWYLYSIYFKIIWIIVLYCRFFWSTKNKLQLIWEDFFSDKQMKIHNNIMEIRNKSFVHNEYDNLLWSKELFIDTVWINNWTPWINISFTTEIIFSITFNKDLLNNMERVLLVANSKKYTLKNEIDNFKQIKKFLNK